MSNTRNVVILTGYYPDQEKMGGGVQYNEGNGDKKSFYRGKISVKRAFKDKDGKNKYDYLTFKCFGSSADFLHNYAKSGDIIQVSGELLLDDNYEKDGKVVYGQMFVKADNVSIISSGDSNEAQATGTDGGFHGNGGGQAAPKKSASSRVSPLSRLHRK